MILGDREDHEVVLIPAGSGEAMTAGQIRARARQLLSSAGQVGLAFLECDNSIGSVGDLLACLEVGIPVALTDPGLAPDLAGRLRDTYRPELLLRSTPPEMDGLREVAPGAWAVPGSGAASHPDLAVLLTTSGSTGSPKFVRLSRRNVLANARQIAASLGLTARDRGVTALPVFYSFGMSVVTSHVVAGSAVVVTDRGVLDRQFWPDLERHEVTFLPGVPQTFAMLSRLGFEDRNLPHLRALIQAGGRLSPALVSHFGDVMAERGGEFYVMYGQTEAAPRMACLPADRLPHKPGSAGLAVPGGRLVAMEGDMELPAGQVGEVVFSGPNVMMGYALDRTDLALGDVHGTTLRTGDLGYVDADGFLFLTGRTKRIAKVAGARVSLDEIEAMLETLEPVAAVDAGDAGVAVYTTIADADLIASTRRHLARRLHVPRGLLTIESVGELPMLGTGKVDYQALAQRARGVRS